MRAYLPRSPFVTAGLACLAAAVFLTIHSSPAQDRPAAPAVASAKDVLPFGPGLLLPTDSALPAKLQAVRDYARARQWAEAASLLQSFLDLPEDVFLPLKRRGPDGKELIAAVSLRAEANRLLDELPRPGLEGYEELVGRQARRALVEARGQPAALALVVQRYPHSKAGAEAAARLGAHHLDRGHFDLAAAYFDHLLRAAGADPQPVLLFQAALAFRRAGRRDRAEQAWKRLAALAPDGIPAGDRTVPLAHLEKELNRPAGAAAEPAAGPLAGEARWRQATVSDGLTRAWLSDAARRQEAAAGPALPAATPLAVGGKAVYRGQRGITAVDLRSGRVAWESSSELALDNLVRSPEGHAHVRPWVESYLAGHPHVLLGNTVLGSLSSDGSRVYAVEDLPVPPYPNNYYAFHLRQGEGEVLAGAPELTDALYHSKLLALDLASGKVVWQLGGHGARGGPLRDCYFLGPPLPLGGKLFVAVQKGFDLRLLCLAPATGEVVWAQTLVLFRSRLVLDGGRRLHAVRPAYGDGLLVCPTHAGGLVAFDLVGRTLAWAHVYREEPPPPEPPPFFGRRGPRPRPVLVREPPNLAEEWLPSAPLIVGDKVVFAATDAPQLCCLGLHDGAPLWEAKRGDGDLFVADAADGSVLVVGRAGVRALSLADGKPLWHCDTPPPTGRGTLVGGAYYLPVRGAGAKPEVLALDLAEGAVAWRVALSDKEAAGNLLYLDGTVLSQTTDGVAAYPRRPAGQKP